MLHRLTALSHKTFRHVETLFIQGVCFYCTGPLLAGAIPPTNSGPGRIKSLHWMNKVSTCRKALLEQVGTGMESFS